MKLAVSNIGWDMRYEVDYLQVLKKNKIKNLEIVPLKIFKNWNNINKKNISKLKLKYNKRGFKIVSMQGIFFNKKYSFYKKKDLEKIVNHFKKIIFISKNIGCNHIVFGSPSMRNGHHKLNKTGLKNFAFVIDRIKSLLTKYKLYLSIEPISAQYSCKLLNNIKQTINFCKKVNNNFIKVQMDIGQMISEKEKINKIENLNNYVKHLHISNINLKNITQNKAIIKKYILQTRKLKTINYASIEMGNNYSVKEMKRAISFARRFIND